MSKFCGECGTPLAKADQHFCQQCGAPTAAVPEAGVSSPPGPSGYPPGPASSAPPGWAPTGHQQVDYAVPAPAVKDRDHRSAPVKRIVTVGAVVLALTGAGLVGWQVLGPKGGADSAEDAVREFLTAAASQDVVGALEMVNPAEVEGIDEVYDAARDRLGEEALVSGGSGITDALSVELEDIDLRTVELGESGARVVLRGGSYTVSYEPDELPERLDFVRDSFPEPKTWSGDILDDVGFDLPDADWENDVPEPFVTAVRLDGRWYVSAVGTLFESWFGVHDAEEYAESGARAPDYDAIDDEVDPIVGEEPEDVLDNLADAASQGDLEEILANFPADEVAALRPYVRSYEDLITDEGVTFDVSVSDVETSVEEEGDYVRMTIEAGSAYGYSIDEDGDTDGGSISVEGRCVTSVDDSYEDSFCIEGEVAGYTGIDSYYVMLRKVDGGYQLDPIATAVEYARSVIESAPSSAVDEALAEICYAVQGYDETGCDS